MNKILLDTNILIYALDKTSVFHQKASQIMQDENNHLFTTTKNISEYFAVCTKLAIGSVKMFGFYNDLQENLTFLYPNQASVQQFELLLRKYQPKGNRVFDVEIVSVMLAYDIKKIATFNIDDFKHINEVEIYSA
jgi:predicted nucleic acid-binding protein